MIPRKFKKIPLVQYMKGWYLFVFFIFSVLFLSACSIITVSPPSDDSPSIIEEESFHIEKDKTQEAYINFTRASLAIFQGDYENARKYLSTAIEKDPESVYLLTKMVMLLKRQKQYQEALTYALKCVELKPEEMKCRILLADLYTSIGEDDLAAEQYEKGISLDPENQRVRLLIVTILIRKNQLPEAIVHLKKLIEQDPELVIAHYYLGKVNMELEHYREAEEAFLEVLKLKESQESAMIDLGTLYQKTSRPNDAVTIYKKLLEFYPDNIAVKIRLANLYTKLGLEKEASQQMQDIKKDTESKNKVNIFFILIESLSYDCYCIIELSLIFIDGRQHQIKFNTTFIESNGFFKDFFCFITFFL